MKLFILLIIFPICLASLSDFCNEGSTLKFYWKSDGWYCNEGDSVKCQNGQVVYNEICPAGCETGHCLPGEYCKLTSPGSRSSYCHFINYSVDRQTNFISNDDKAIELYNSMINNFSYCSDLIYKASCYQTYKSCDGLDICKNAVIETNECIESEYNITNSSMKLFDIEKCNESNIILSFYHPYILIIIFFSII